MAATDPPSSSTRAISCLAAASTSSVRRSTKYDPASGAPRVVAKGRGAIATKIRERAHEHRVPLVKDVPLARAVHGACEVGDEIPPELYAAIARVLAFLFSLKARGVAAGTHVVPQPALALSR